MNTNKHELDEIASRVIGAAYEVSNTLGAGFLEKVYERAMLKELELRGLRAKSQVAMNISYKGHSIGDYIADMVVEDKLVVELKCVDSFAKLHTAQVPNYLRASGLKLGLLINFQRPKVDWKRIIY